MVLRSSATTMPHLLDGFVDSLWARLDWKESADVSELPVMWRS